MKALKKYLSIMHLGIKSGLVFRANYLIKIATQALSLLVTLWMWQWIGNGQKSDLTSISQYLIITNLLSLVFSISPAFNLANLIKSGKLSFYLTRPVSLYGHLYLQFLGSQLPLLAVYLVVVLAIHLSADIIISLVLYVMVTSIMFFNLMMITGSLAFWLINLWPLRSGLYAIYLLLGGLYFPLKMLGSRIYSWLKYNPFSLVTDIPANIAIAKVDQLQSYYLAAVIWAIVFYLGYRLIYAKGQKKYEGVGV